MLALAIISILVCYSLSASPRMTVTEEYCSELSSPISAEDSPQKEHFQNVLKQGMDAPIGEFLKLWYPDNKSEAEVDTYFFHCQEPWGPIGGYFDLRPKCRPDVLYSWGGIAKLKEIQETLPDDQIWTGSPNPSRKQIYTALSPISTYAYGLVQIRFKVRSEIPFIAGSKYGDFPKQVRVATLSYQEFIIDDASILESWSYGTPEQYDEIVKDILRISSGKRAQGFYIGPPEERDLSVSGMNRIYGSLADGLAVTEETLKRNLLELIRMILNREGRIHYAQDVCRSRRKHFLTERPTYFNPE